MNSSSDILPNNLPMAARLTDAVSSVAELLEQRRLSYALIGGLSVAFRGSKRSTDDADFLLHIPALSLPDLLQSMIEVGCNIDEVAAIRQWATDGILVIRWPNGVQIDLLKAIVPAFHHVLHRGKMESFGTGTIRVADAEGLLLLKLIAFRPLDQEDIRGILLANANQLDLDWVRSEAQLAGIDNERLVEFEGLVQNFYIK